MMEDLSNHQFQAVVRLPIVTDELSFLLLEDTFTSCRKQDHSGRTLNQQRECLRGLLKFIDKKIFLKFRQGELTLDQVEARVNGCCFGVKYKVLDDLRD